MKTLKEKISIVYIFLVCIIAAVGLSSVFNFYKLGKAINGLMVDNYKSINSASQMVEILENQNLAALDYIYTGKQSSSDIYFSYTGKFYKWYNIEANNITEHGERDIVNRINDHYTNYQMTFSNAQKIKDSKGEAAAISYYSKNVAPEFNKLRYELKNLIALNEKSMFKGKTDVTGSAKESMHIIMVLSISVIILGFFISNYLTSKFLRPLYMLKENIKSIKEGNLYPQNIIQTDDEIGDLALEFNKMTMRLQQFEKSTKGKLMEEKNKSLAIVKSISDPLIVLDMNYKVVLVNHACEKFFDIDESSSLGKHFLEVIANGDIFDHIVKARGDKEEKYKPKIISVMAHEKEFFFDTIVTKVKDEEEKMAGLVILFQNVTNLKKLEKTKTDFVSTISHEFKTPLTSIMMGTSLLESDGLGDLNRKQKEILFTIQDDTERLTSLVTDLIQLAKIESDKNVYNFEECSPYGIVQNSIRGFGEIAAGKDVKIQDHMDDKLPKVKADFEKVSWVVNNLISNAMKYTDSGDTITVSAGLYDDEMLYIKVKDTGAGIAEEYIEKIFEKFFKVADDEGETKGTGLGLAISREIINAHGGEIWCSSILGEGSEFTFTLPIYKMYGGKK